LEEAKYWRHPVSAIFHGRDILGPWARPQDLAAIARSPGRVMPVWGRLDPRPPGLAPDARTGAVVFVDHFGNLITNIPGNALANLPAGPVRLRVGDREEAPRPVRTYAEGEPGRLLLLTSSTGLLEVAVNQGSAARRLGATVGTPV